MEQVDHPFRLRSKAQDIELAAAGDRVARGDTGRCFAGGEQIRIQQRGEGHGAEAPRRSTKEVPARHGVQAGGFKLVEVHGIDHSLVMVSSRFRSTLAIPVQATRSSSLSLAERGESPMERRSKADFRSF